MKTKPGDQIARLGVYIRLDDLENSLIGNKEVMCRGRRGGWQLGSGKYFLNLGNYYFSEMKKIT